jgi:hypothetical protein
MKCNESAITMPDEMKGAARLRQAARQMQNFLGHLVAATWLSRVAVANQFRPHDLVA